MANETNLGFEHRYAFAASPATFSSGSLKLDPLSSTVKERSAIWRAMGLTGSRDPQASRRRKGLREVSGTLGFKASPRNLDFFLPFVLGANESTDAFNVADALPGFDMLEDKFGTGDNADKFNECYVSRFTLNMSSSGQDGILGMSLDVVGKTVAGGQAFTSAALGTTAGVDSPYTFYDTDGGITLVSGNGAIEIEEAVLTVENPLDVKFRNKRTAASIRAMDRTVTLVARLPLTEDNYADYFGDQASADASIVIDNGTVVTTISLFNLEIADEGPETQGLGESLLVLTGTSAADTSDPSVRWSVVGGSL